MLKLVQHEQFILIHHFLLFCTLVSNSLTSVEQALFSGDEDKLYQALSSPALGLQSLKSKNKGWYLKQLMADREAKEQVMEEK